MKNFLLLLLLICMSVIPAYSQHEADNWYFGGNAGISFKSGTATVLSDGKIVAFEGCAVVSDKKTGALLFYTDGNNVWNNTHQIVKNGTGLKGHTSSTQNALIVPDPGNNQQYYIFTVSGIETKDSCFYYSIISLENPGGEIISKNNLLIKGVSEKLTGTIDCAGTGFWIVTHGAVKSSFYSFHLSEKGINTIPVISHYVSSQLVTDTKSYIFGCMKISPDNTKIALASTSFECLSLFDFDASSGEVTNYKRLDEYKSKPLLFYGVSFSPDSKLLYASMESNFIYQYEVTLPTEASIRGSVYKLGSGNTFPGGIQLAPDGKIYIAQAFMLPTSSPTFSQYLTVINKPNGAGIACLYKEDAFLLSRDSYFGLPNFMDYIFNSKGSTVDSLSGCSAPIANALPDSNCLGSNLVFTDRSIFRTTFREWTFENGTPAISSDSIVSVSYTQPGTYKVRLVVSNEKGSDTTYTQAIVFPIPNAKAGADRSFCKIESTQLGKTPEPNNTYSWQPASNLDDPTKSNPIATPTTTTQYILTVTNSNGCIAFDTVVINVFNITENLPIDTVLCAGSSIQLMATPASDYSWTPPEGLDNPKIRNPIATPLTTTTYRLIASNGVCKDSAFVKITVNPTPVSNAGEDKFICLREKTLIGSTQVPGNTYSWQPITNLSNATNSNPIATPSTTTHYILTVTNTYGCVAFDTVVVNVFNINENFLKDTVICAGASIQLTATDASEYSWSPSKGLDNPKSRNPIATPLATTTYTLKASNGTCIDSTSITIAIVPPPIAKAGNDTGICIGETANIGSPSIAGYTYSWTPAIGLSSPNSAKTTATPNETTSYILKVSNSFGCIAEDTVVVNVFSTTDSVFTLNPPIISFIPGQILQTSLHIPGSVRSWLARLDYDKSVMEYSSILTTTNGITAQATKNQNGEVTIKGAGGNGEVVLQFSTFLPFSLDTVFSINLLVDSSRTTSCRSISATGTIIELGEYCSRKLRRVNISEKSYFLTTKENGVNFGVGLSGNVRIELYDYIGSLKVVLVNGNLEASEYGLDFDVPTGVYFCRMSAGLFEDVCKVMIINK